MRQTRRKRKVAAPAVDFDGGGVALLEPPAPAPAAPPPAVVGPGPTPGPAPGLSIGTISVGALASSNLQAARASLRVSLRRSVRQGAKAITASVAPPTLDYGTPADGEVGTAYSVTPTTSGAGVTYSVTSGSLPSGLSLNSSTGEISGTPDAAGSSNFEITATNAGGSAVDDVTITIAWGDVFAGTGFTYVSAEDVLTKAWTDPTGTTQHDGTDETDVRRLEPTGGALWDNQQNASTFQFYYADGNNARAINGFPVYYNEQGTVGSGMNSDVGADTILSAKEFDLIMVVRRLSDGNNMSVVTLGANRPVNVRMYSSSVARAYGFLTAYVEANNSNFTTGAHVLHVRFDNTSKKLKIAIDGGAFVEVAESADWSPDTGKFSLGKGDCAWACYGVYDGLYSDYATLVSNLKSKYGIS